MPLLCNQCNFGCAHGLHWQRTWGTAYRFTPCRRDGHKKGWLESYKGKDGIAKIHAFGQLENGKQYLKDMLNEPPVTHTVEISWGNRHNVGSKDNPFIKREKEMYTETLHPQVSLPTIT